ncbi:I78 family peptidase inhibitor [Yoonia sp.]|uniref:I78 family peptidase inhibitor n=1 Tax=Yoonia sp. TaxID=2212373 RepID=UPI00391C9B37
MTAIALGLMACEPVLAEDDACNADAYAHLVGADVTATDGVTADGPVRVLRPDDVVTMEFRGDRLNFALDEQDRIVRVYCG